MTPKDKAKELFDKLSEVRNYTSYASKLCDSAAKQCALVTVDEMISEFNTIDPEKVSELVTNHVSYWQEVKQELNKL